MKFIFLAFLFFSVADPATAHGVQHITVSQPVFDFGSVPQGKKVEHAFLIKNNGDTPLSIKSIRPSCGCTAANAATLQVQPGKSTEIKVTFNSSNFAGVIHKTIILETDDPKTPVHTLALKGSVIEEVTVSPRQINLGLLKANATKETAVTVVNNGRSPIKLLSVKTPLPQIIATLSKNLIKPGESGIINVIASLRSGDQLLSGYLTIKTDAPGRAEIIVPIYASVTK
jgi:copper(I)-binding protein